MTRIIEPDEKAVGRVYGKYNELLQFGARFTRLASLGLARSAGTQREYLFACDCGDIKWASGSMVARGVIRSCGCLGREYSAARCKSRSTHGLTQSPLYGTWVAMMDRCYDPTHNRYHCYGGIGVMVCERWHDIRNFVVDMGATYFDGATLDRKNNGKVYCSEECRWATQKVQQNNRRNNHVMVFRGETKTLSQWAEALGMKVSTLISRTQRGWSVERALTQGVRPW